MKAQHQWANSWPGNYCLRCGIDEVLESAICCPLCYVPCDAEEEARDPVIRLCPEHQAWADIPCVQTALILHPTERDPFGVLTTGQIHQAHFHAQSFYEGWTQATHQFGRTREPDYTDIRDHLLMALWDMPYEHACQVALYVTSLHSEYVFDFRPVL